MIRDIHEQQSKIYDGLGRPAEALVSFKAFKTAHDSLFNSDAQSVIAELQAQYQNKEQAQQIKLLKQARQYQRLWNARLIAGIVLFGAIAFLGYSGYQNKKRALSQLDKAHQKLKSTQAQLIQQEKLASLGQLTAGIAHEIKNPLNFVNNFSQLNGELIEEIEENPEASISEVKDLIDTIKQNGSIIQEHGHRADRIIQSMMQHAHGMSGERKQTELNKFIDSYINLAYHGMQAQYKGFTVTFERDYDESVGSISIIPQDIGQVLINLMNNAFDAMRVHKAEAGDDYTPILKLSTKKSDENVIIQVTDNGPGIPQDVLERIFEPFFTTKPAGSGTGLGLSLSYDIITQGHAGQMSAQNADGEGASFIIKLPRNQES